MPLSDEERTKIYEEEREKIEARERIESSKKRKKRWWIWGIILGIFAVMVLFNQAMENPHLRTDLTDAPMTPRCDAKKADDLLQKLIDEGVFYKVEGGEIPNIYVSPLWYGRTIDDKKTFDNVAQCSFTRGLSDPIFAIYKDAQTGKNVATSNLLGFEME